MTMMHTQRYTPEQEEALAGRVQRMETYLAKQSQESEYLYTKLSATIQTLEKRLDDLAQRVKALEDQNAS